MTEQEKITLIDLLDFTADGTIKWRKVEATNHIAFASHRAVFLNRLYILESTGRLTVWNCRTDALIWFDKDAKKLLNQLLL